MIELYPIQVIALDKASHQALDLVELKKFSEVSKIEAGKLSASIIEGHYQVLLLSELDDTILSEIISEYPQMNEPIIMMPSIDEESASLKSLRIMGFRIIFTSDDTIDSISLANALGRVENFFYGNDSDMEISVDHEDIYTVINRGTATQFDEESGRDISVTALSLFNTPKGFSDTTGVYILFEVSEDFPLLNISEAMDIVENILPKSCDIVFGTRVSKKNTDSVKIVSMVSRYADFSRLVQKQIDESKTYLQKSAVIVDAVNDGSISYDDATLLAMKNHLDMNDIEVFYDLTYAQPAQLVELMRLVRDESVTKSRKEEAIADLLKETSLDTDLLEEIALTQQLATESILQIVQLKNEGRLPLEDMKISGGLQEKYPNLSLAKSADTPVLVNREKLHDESMGMVTVETDDLKLYERDGVEWFVGRDLSEVEIDGFVEAYGVSESGR